MSEAAIEALLEDPDKSVRPCLFDFTTIVIKKLEDTLKKKFDKLMAIFIHQKALDTQKYNDLKEEFVRDIMTLLRPKFEGLFKEDKLNARIQAVNPKREYNCLLEEAKVIANLLKPFKEEELETFKQLRDKVAKLKKTEEQIIEELKMEMTEVQAKQQAVKNKTLKMISEIYKQEAIELPVMDFD